MEEQMFSKLLLASVAAIGLLLAGPQKASAQTIFACVSSIGNIVIVAANANCPPAGGGPTWTKISWNASSAQPASTTNLLFPFVVNANGFDTGIAISNTSADPFSTATGSGTCTLSIYSTGVTPVTFTTPTIAPGTTFTTVLSTIAAGTQGYIFAACNFSFAHGLASVSKIAVSGPFSTYLALVIQTPRPNGENLNN
jgi:hypothetical protein